jgi:hypothetical protein
MKLTQKSQKFMQFLNDHPYIHPIYQSKTTNEIITELYNDLLESYKYLLSIKQTKNYYNVTIKQIVSAVQIPKPQTFNSNSFPSEIRQHINELSITEICYTFSLFERKVKVFFILEDRNIELKIDMYNKYIDSIIMWLYILQLYGSKECVDSLTIFFYFTSLEKKLPDSNILILNEVNVNTAFTSTCPKISEIVVFRKEEWFKVFIHETFHNFGLDFSDMNNTTMKECILNIFKVNSEVNLYESYTEFWAEIMNAIFCSFYSLKDKTDIPHFLSNVELFINFERSYSFFQLVKTLNFMGLTYKDLYLNNKESIILRENLYKEKTNVLAYYVIKTVLLNNYPSFLQWCKKNNLSLLQFKKTIGNQEEFCKFIKKNYKSKDILESIHNTEHFLVKHKNKRNKNNYLLSNMRMTVCELG